MEGSIAVVGFVVFALFMAWIIKIAAEAKAERDEVNRNSTTNTDVVDPSTNPSKPTPPSERQP